MPRASKFKFDPKQLQELTDHFSFLISSLNNSDEIHNFYEEFFTKEEKIMLAKRLILFMMIQREYSPTNIQQALHVSYETVRLYTDRFEDKNELFRKTIDRLVSREKTQEFWRKVEKLLKPVELGMRAKSDMKSRAKLIHGNWS